MTTARRKRPSSLPPADGLSAAFTGLVNALPPRPTVQAPPPQDPPATPPTPPVEAAPEPEPTVVPAAVEEVQPPAAPSAAGGRRVQVALHVAVKLVEQLSEYRTQHQVTNAHAVIHIINQVGAHLGGTSVLSSAPDAVALIAPSAPTRLARNDGITRGPLTLSMTTAERDQLDQVVTRLGYGSRSALVEAALDQFFTPSR